MTSPRFEYDKLIYKGRVIEVHSVGVRMSDGRVLPRDYVHYSDAVVVLPVLDDGRIVLIRNQRFAVDEELLELPAGMVDAGERVVEVRGDGAIEAVGDAVALAVEPLLP